ncbi:MAG: efflux RND transporter periplasmic adaptor subunit [Bryobacteraceae bacterium]
MSAGVAPTAPSPAGGLRPQRPARLLRGIAKAVLTAALLVAAGAGIVWQAKRMYKAVKPPADTVVPTTRVRRANLTLTVSARGELRGGNSEVLSAPLTTGGELHITTLRKTGEVVKAGDVVVEFDSTDQEYRLKEAEADLAEAKLKVEQAKAQAQAQLEEDTYSLASAEHQVHLAELDVRKNPILSAIQARQNDLALQAARDRWNQIRQDIGSRKATNQAAVEVEEAGVGKADVEVATAKKNMEALTLRAHGAGYVALKRNSSGNFFMEGMTLPDYQPGDTVRAGMAIAEIPDLHDWAITATIGELDRGHLALGQKVDVMVVALPGRAFHGHVVDLGGTSGSPWDRHFECRMRFDDPAPEMRPGMSVRIVITTDVLRGVLWIPAQALFESGSRVYVYTPSGAGFAPRDVKLVRRSESQVVVEGLREGQVVALANPEQAPQKKAAGTAAPLPQ